jgi:fibronectin type 3 domain-containing protein
MDSGVLGDGVQNYRAFRYNWTGLPNEDPAIVALESTKGTNIYVSWNGDTETAVWRFYATTDGFGSRHFLGQVDRKGFETKLLVPNQRIKSVSAEAFDASGKLLISTAIVKSEWEITAPKTKDASLKTSLIGEVEEQKSFKLGSL